MLPGTAALQHCSRTARVAYAKQSRLRLAGLSSFSSAGCCCSEDKGSKGNNSSLGDLHCPRLQTSSLSQVQPSPSVPCSPAWLAGGLHSLWTLISPWRSRAQPAAESPSRGFCHQHSRTFCGKTWAHTLPEVSSVTALGAAPGLSPAGRP